METASIYDYACTSRELGRPDDSLHEVVPVQLTALMPTDVREGSHLDTSSAFKCEHLVPETQSNRSCASGPNAGNFAAGKI